MDDTFTAEDWAPTIQLCVPPRYRACRLAQFSPDVVRDAERFLAPGGVSMFYVYGEVGCGKTSLAAAMLMRWRWLNRQALYLDGTTSPGGKGIFLPAYVAAEQIRLLDETREAREAWKQTPLLVLDDLGANRMTPHVTESLLFLLQRRYDWLRKTVVTSNLDLAGLERDLDRRAASRMQIGTVLNLGDKDRRVGGGE